MPKRLTAVTLPIVLALFAGCMLAAGCSPKAADQGQIISRSPEELRKEEAEAIEKIKNDPTMPPQAKAAALQGRERAKAAALAAQKAQQAAPQ